MTTVLAVNPGSSSLKLSAVRDGATVADHLLERWTGTEHAGPLQGVLAQVGAVDAVGVRVVHGGPRTGACAVDDALVAELEALTELAPLHQPRALAALRAVRSALPGVPVVACFDTSFHTTLPPAAATYAVPRDWTRRWGLRRYGFHGLSHAYASRRAREVVGPGAGRVVVCHLGSGASVCGTVDGRSVDTSMGFTPLEGLVMRTRSGSVDPGMLLWLLRTGRLDVDGLAEGLQTGAGLAGLSGTSGDLRDVEAAAQQGDPDARLALDVFGHRLAREVAATAASTGGLDVLVLTGGIGEHGEGVRADLARRLAHLGVEVGPVVAPHGDDLDVTGPGSRVRVLVVRCREDLEMATEVRTLLDLGPTAH